jgi:cation transport ATPase
MTQSRHHDHGHHAAIDPATVVAGVTYTPFGILQSPILAGAATAFSSVAVIPNSIRLNRVQL